MATGGLPRQLVLHQKLQLVRHGSIYDAETARQTTQLLMPVSRLCHPKPVIPLTATALVGWPDVAAKQPLEIRDRHLPVSINKSSTCMLVSPAGRTCTVLRSKFSEAAQDPLHEQGIGGYGANDCAVGEGARRVMAANGISTKVFFVQAG